jgi:hypothetical protein
MFTISKYALIAALVSSTITVATTGHAQNVVTRPVVGVPSRTTITSPDGSKEVITPDGRHSFYNPNGTPRGMNQTCSNGGGMIVTCTNWGPNSYVAH